MTSLFSLPFLTLFVYLFLVVAGPCLSQTTAINDLENQLFFRQYDGENDSARLSRIENYIFGQQYNDSIENRIARIKATVPSTNVPAPLPPNSSQSSESNVPPPQLAQPSGEDNGDTQDRQIQVMQARASQVNTLLSQAVSLYRQKQYKEAIDLFEQVLRLDPQNASAHFSLGIAMEANGNLNEAAAQYDQAVSIDTGNKDYQSALLNIKNKIDQENKSKTENYKWQMLAAQAADALKNGQFDQALAMYTQLVEKEPRQSLYQYNLGTVYLMLKRPDDALPHYKSAHKLDPANIVYEQSLQKLEQSVKETKELKTAQEKKAKENAPKKIDLSSTFGLEVKSSHNGVMVKKVSLGSRAAQVGLYPLDVIKAVDGQPITKISDLERLLSSKPLGQRFQMVLIRRNVTCQLLF